jgi:hypothetical protein
MQSVLEYLGREFIDYFTIIFFDRFPSLPTSFGYAMREIANLSLGGGIFTLVPDQIAASATIIQQATIDILLYMALPTDKLTYMLAHQRLATIQIQIGIGHPISSGISDTIDYSIAPTSMLLLTNKDFTPLTNYTHKNSIICAFEATTCDLSQVNETETLFDYCQLSKECYDISINRHYYTEQLVLFDEGLVHVIPNPIDFHLDNHLIHNSIERLTKYQHYYEDLEPIQKISCQELANIMNILQLDKQEIVILHNHDDNHNQYISRFLQAEDIGCFDETLKIDQKGNIHIYFVIQFLKKFHVLMDDILVSIIHYDSKARIMLRPELKILLPRWQQRYESLFFQSIDLFTLSSFFLWLPQQRIPHESYLGYIGLSRVFLNTIPIGAGMTSSEAIAMCTPVIVMPQQTNVLQFAFAQLQSLKSLTKEDLNHMVVESSHLIEYVEKAVSLAYGKTKHFQSTEENQSTKSIDIFGMTTRMCQSRAVFFGTKSDDDDIQEDFHDPVAINAREWARFLTRAYQQSIQ